jgi:predicted ATPase
MPSETFSRKEAARQALLSHRASRNFRNIWWHYPDDFEECRELVRETWPGMDMERPELYYDGPQILRIFRPEQRFPREIYWAGFGFQVWCQMLTYVVRCRNDSIFLIDEPDIYLHSDLQRQLVGTLRDLGPDILMATHSAEIIAEADLGDLLTINRRFKSRSESRIQANYKKLLPSLGPISTQF